MFSSPFEKEGLRGISHGSHALRGNGDRDALRPEPQARFELHSHAERGNE
jgi:putative ATP-binding cassette transporter